MSTKNLMFSLSFVFISLFIFTRTQAQTADTKGKEVKFEKEANAKCLKCHGHTKYEYKNMDSTKTIKRRMGTNFVISQDLFYESNHKTFKCTDCHSEDYKNFPHKPEVMYQDKGTCVDCHAGDPKFAEYKFEQIDADFQNSVHSTKHSKDFTCWMCHNPHTYKTTASKHKDIRKTVAYDNSICLSCHADINKYQLISDSVNPNILKKHEWLPNQENHFRHVRCIECHARVNDSLLVSHNVQTKDKAVKRCVECHSSNSLLLQTLYRYEISSKLNKQGFFNAIMLKDFYVVGANRNYYLNLISAVLFGLVLLIIAIHATLRYTNRKK